MKAVLTINDKQELQTMLGRKPIILKLPRLKEIKSKDFWGIVFLLSAIALLVPIVTYNFGFRNGSTEGYAKGHDAGYNQAVQEMVANTHLTFTDALAWNIRLHLDTYVAWFGLVIGLAWVFHGVGFHLVKL